MGEGQAGGFSAPLAFGTEHGADTDLGAGVDATPFMLGAGYPGGHPGIESCAARVGELFSHWKCDGEVFAGGYVYVETPAKLEGKGKRPELEAGTTSQMGPGLLLQIGALSPSRYGLLSGESVMQHQESSSVSRVREIRTYGLKGGPVFLRHLQGNRNYQRLGDACSECTCSSGPVQCIASRHSGPGERLVRYDSFKLLKRQIGLLGRRMPQAARP